MQALWADLQESSGSVPVSETQWALGLLMTEDHRESMAVWPHERRRKMDILAELLHADWLPLWHAIRRLEIEASSALDLWRPSLTLQVLRSFQRLCQNDAIDQVGRVSRFFLWSSLVMNCQRSVRGGEAKIARSRIRTAIRHVDLPSGGSTDRLVVALASVSTQSVCIVVEPSVACRCSTAQ
jgi:hypothetical protein